VRPLNLLLSCGCGVLLAVSVQGAAEALPRPVDPPALKPASKFVAPTGSDESACSRAAPCLTFDHAYHLAKPGQIVEVAGGSYGTQAIIADPRKAAGPPVVFRPAAKATVQTSGTFFIYGQNITFDGTGGAFRFGGWFVRRGADHITFRRTQTGLFLCGGASNLRVEGGEVGPWTSQPDAEDTQITLDDGVPCSNVTIKNVFFHDMLPSGGSHTDCLQITAGRNITIDGNRFVRCWSDAIIAKTDFGDIVNLVIQNNLILDPINGDGSTSYAVGVFDDAAGAPGARHTCSSLIRNNSFAALHNGELTVKCQPNGLGNRVYGNLFALGTSRPNCARNGAVWQYNVWETRPSCGSHAYVLPARDARYVDRTKGDLRLRRNSGAINRGYPSNFPRLDFLGRRRPRGTRPDAGAYEFPLPKRLPKPRPRGR
jgi:hypothetical protein